MIISHKHRFIFIKTKKTAGTSIEIALSAYLGDDDIITPVTPKDEAVRMSLGFRGPQNYQVPLRRYSARDWARALRSRQWLSFYNHIGAADISRFVGPKVWESYFKFCFERNPWDQVISMYYWLHPQQPRPSFESFVASSAARELAGPGGVDLYSLDGRTAVDKVYRYEDLEGAMRDISKRLSLPDVPQLPLTKADTRKDRGHYRDMYSSRRERDLVEEIFARQIRERGYVF